ncbi:MAG: hypothetical protein Fur0021_23130 [Candidatus Promineifilaceae bacterium]
MNGWGVVVFAYGSDAICEYANPITITSENNHLNIINWSGAPLESTKVFETLVLWQLRNFRIIQSKGELLWKPK